MKTPIFLFPLAMLLVAAATPPTATATTPASSAPTPAALSAAAKPGQIPEPAPVWSYEKMRQEADLIIIATPVAVRDLGQKTILPDIQRMGADNTPHPVDAIGMECNLSVETVLKGNLKDDHLGIYYLREANPPANSGGQAPMLISFDIEKNNHYLLFLKKNASGAYEPLSGLTDSALAIQLLRFAP